MSSELFQHINYKKAYRKNRLNAANWVLANPETLKQLIDYCFHDEQQLATKATWVLEFVFRDNLKLLLPFLDEIFKKLPTAKSDGQLRSFGLLCELLALAYYKKQDDDVRETLTAKHKKVMTECCFDWMITDQKVACQARAMLALFYLGTEIDWIHSELVTIISQKLPNGSAGYINRGQKVLLMISKQQNS